MLLHRRMNGCRLSIIFLRLWYILGGAGRPGDAAAEIAMRAGAVALWRYEAIRPRSWRPRHAGHRPRGRTGVLVLENPGLRGASSITRTLYAGLQLILPGEVARSHRHTQSALRFVSEGKGAYTAVDGERASMHPGDNWDRSAPVQRQRTNTAGLGMAVPFYGGTNSSNPLPSSGESRAKRAIPGRGPALSILPAASVSPWHRASPHRRNGCRASADAYRFAPWRRF